VESKSNKSFDCSIAVFLAKKGLFGSWIFGIGSILEAPSSAVVQLNLKPAVRCGRCGQEQDDNILTVLRNKVQVCTGGDVSQLGGSFTFVYFHFYSGKIPILTNTFHMGR